jgi:citrate synthase
MPSTDRPLLSTEEAARRLGVKPETLYAYVSRGVVSRTRGPDGRTSLFDPSELDRLAARPRLAAAPRAGVPGVRTALTDVGGGRFAYRGRDVVPLAGVERFEAVARWLWRADLDPAPFSAPADLVVAARRAAHALAFGVRPVDRVAAAVTATAVVDPLRGDLRPDAVAATAAGLLAAAVDGQPGWPVHPTDPLESVPVDGDRSRRDDGWLAARLWPALTVEPPCPAVLDAALTLLADDELDSATFAARVAASTRANPYAVVRAGLAVLEGPSYGPVSAAVHRALADASRDGAPIVLARLLADGRPLPGFHDPRFPDGDPRGRRLLELLAADPPDRDRWGVVQAYLETSRRGEARPPTVDFALGALTYVSGMPPEAGEAVFAIARSAGWIAHALEEYGEEPHRLTPRGTYTGARPGPAQP